jgi:pyridoxamine 5'-phosphate oxidase
VVASRERLEELYAEMEQRYEGEPVPRPSDWGGWRLVPDSVEFWQGQPNRFHDRVRYVKVGAAWQMERLAP